MPLPNQHHSATIQTIIFNPSGLDGWNRIRTMDSVYIGSSDFRLRIAARCGTKEPRRKFMRIVAIVLLLLLPAFLRAADDDVLIIEQDYNLVDSGKGGVEAK